MKKIKSRKHGQKSMAMKRLRVKKKKIMNIRSNLAVLNHISKKNCALLPYDTVSDVVESKVHQCQQNSDA